MAVELVFFVIEVTGTWVRRFTSVRAELLGLRLWRKQAACGDSRYKGYESDLGNHFGGRGELRESASCFSGRRGRRRGRSLRAAFSAVFPARRWRGALCEV
jgi:hypothetical protein